MSGNEARVALKGGFRLAEVTVQPQLGSIMALSRESRVAPRAMDVLVALASRAGSTVSRDELIAAVWNRT